ncbi:hypothetical protein ACNPLN_06740 [Klebsiella pneumoniae]
MTTDITELAQRMSIERIKQIALGATPTMGEREGLAITALHFAEELKIATDAFQAAGLAQLAAEEALEKAQTKAIEQGHTACELFDEVTALRQRIAELESCTVTVKLPNQTQFDDPLSAYEAIEKCKEALTAQGIKWEAE